MLVCIIPPHKLRHKILYLGNIIGHPGHKRTCAEAVQLGKRKCHDSAKTILSYLIYKKIQSPLISNEDSVSFQSPACGFAVCDVLTQLQILKYTNHHKNMSHKISKL